MDLRLPAAALLLGASAFLGRLADERRATPPPEPGVASLLGGFSAIATQALWMRAARALEERREDEAVLALRTLVELEPQLVSASRHAAETIGRDLAAGRPDPVRWGMTRDGLRILDGAVAANPGSAAAFRERGAYLFLHVAQDEFLAAAFRRDVSPGGPFAAARADLDRAAAIDPDDVTTQDLRSVAALREGMEHVEARRWAAAAEALRRSVAAYDACRRILVGALDAAELAADPSFAALETARGLAADLLAAVEAPEAERGARVEAVRARHGLR